VRSYLPLLHLTTRIFSGTELENLLEGLGGPLSGEDGDPGAATGRIAMEWLREGGKRLRPFITLAAYAAAWHGETAFGEGVAEDGLIPPAVRRIALAIEVLHKASLVHDDIEDDDAFRYGRRTVHRVHGIGPAVNVGDYLIGLGYALVAGGASQLGDACVADILARLARAHLDLCRGQGAELLWQERLDRPIRPVDVLGIYALKTAPAFEAALHAGLRAAGGPFDAGLLRRFATNLGSAFQIADDLADWRNDGQSAPSPDVLGRRPTILRAFAEETDGGRAVQDAVAAAQGSGPGALSGLLRQIYSSCGAFARAERLYGKLRDRALADAGEFPTPALCDLLRFLTRMVLPPEAPGTSANAP
jgi:geranylgeranyl pyrophosphate synthase